MPCHAGTLVVRPGTLDPHTPAPTRGGAVSYPGLSAETVGPGAEGSAVNVALPARIGDASWLRAFHAIIPPLPRQFWPQVFISKHSYDTHRLDLLARPDRSIDV
jgi:acetoin utilization deacetylase AcuC-like enzyme